MNSFKKILSWLIKTSAVLAVIAFAVIYVCSFIWFKLGLSSTQTMFGYAIFKSDNTIKTPSLDIGDLVIAKEYLFDSAPEKYDFVVYKFNDKFEISIVEEESIDEDDIPVYKVVPSNTNDPMYLHKDDFIGELVLIVGGMGSIIMALISPLFVASFYILLILFIIIAKCRLKKIRNVADVVIDTSNINTSTTTEKNDDTEESNDNVIEKIGYINNTDVYDNVADEEAETIETEEAETIETEEAETIEIEEAETIETEEAETIEIEEAETIETEEAETIEIEEAETIDTEEAETIKESSQDVIVDNNVKVESVSKSKKVKHCKKKSISREKRKNKNKNNHKKKKRKNKNRKK